MKIRKFTTITWTHRSWIAITRFAVTLHLGRCSAQTQAPSANQWAHTRTLPCLAALHCRRVVRHLRAGTKTLTPSRRLRAASLHGPVWLRPKLTIRWQKWTCRITPCSPTRGAPVTVGSTWVNFYQCACCRLWQRTKNSHIARTQDPPHHTRLIVCKRTVKKIWKIYDTPLSQVKKKPWGL